MQYSARARSSSAKAFAIVALFAVVQFGVLALLAATQRDAAHIIDISGSQRARSQRLALLVVAAHAGRPLPGWREELERTIAEVNETRAELAKRSDLRTGAVGHDGLTETGRMYVRYMDAARKVEGNPNDDGAYETIRHDRTLLFDRLDAAVHLRVAIFERYDRWLVGAMLVGLLGQIAATVLAWRRVMLPSMRLAETALAELEESQRQFRSLFAQNPNAIGVYGRDGVLVRGNRASFALLGAHGGALIGQHFSKHVAEFEVVRNREAFDAALAGRTSVYDTTFRSTSGEEIAVNVSVFPKIEAGRITGVIGVAKDVRELRLAEAGAREQSERVAELYELSAGSGSAWEQQIDETIRVAARRLGFAFGILSELRGERLVSIGIVGDSGFDLGYGRPVDQTLSRHAIASRDIWFVEDLHHSRYAGDATGRAGAWRAVVIVPLEIGKTMFGSLALGSLAPRTSPFSPADRHYMSLVASLLASGIQRAQHERKLDSLAFFDRLTGLPNRTLMDNTLSEIIDAGSRDTGSLAILYVDLDRFKEVNDASGHATGDEVLRLAAARMQSCVRSNDTVARIGGDEFVVLQHLPNGRVGASVLAERLIATLEKPFVIDGRSHEIGASIGISILGDDGVDARTLLARADEALYRAKRAGRNRLEFAT